MIIGSKKILEAVEAATGRRWHINTILRWLKTGFIKGRRLGKKSWVIEEEEIEKVLKGENSGKRTG